MNRRNLLQGTGSAVGLALLSIGGSFAQAVPAVPSRFKLVPVEGQSYSPSFRRFMRRSEFSSATEAVASIRSRRVRVAIQRLS